MTSGVMLIAELDDAAALGCGYKDLGAIADQMNYVLFSAAQNIAKRRTAAAIEQSISIWLTYFCV